MSTTREIAAISTFNRGVALGVLGRWEEEIAVFDELIARDGDRDELALRERVAQALYSKGFRLGVLGRSEGEIAVYDELIARVGDRDELALRELVANALYNKGVRLGAGGIGNLLATRRGRRQQAEAAYRDAIAAGHADGWVGVGNLLAKQRGRSREAEVAYREAIAAGAAPAYAWKGLGWVLAKQPGREEEAEAAYREAIAASDSDQILPAAAANLGELLARQGDLAGARAAYETGARAFARRRGADLSDSTIARLARMRIAVASRPWLLRLKRLLARRSAG